LFLVGETLDEEGEDGEIIEGGYGVMIVARAIQEREDTYCVSIWHELYPETLQRFGPIPDGPPVADRPDIRLRESTDG
jgi:hypothetical protein